jgi:hypothetical protein
MRGGQNSERNCRASPALFGGRPAISIARSAASFRAYARRGEHVIDRRPHDALNTRGGLSGSMPTPR